MLWAQQVQAAIPEVLQRSKSVKQFPGSSGYPEHNHTNCHEQYRHLLSFWGPLLLLWSGELQERSWPRSVSTSGCVEGGNQGDDQVAWISCKYLNSLGGIEHYWFMHTIFSILKVWFAQLWALKETREEPSILEIAYAIKREHQHISIKQMYFIFVKIKQSQI